MSSLSCPSESGATVYLNLTASAIRSLSSLDLVGLNHLLRIEVGANLTRHLGTHPGKFGVDLQRILARIHPVDRLAIGLTKARIDLRLALEALHVRDVYANGVVLNQRKIGGSHNDSDVDAAGNDG